MAKKSKFWKYFKEYEWSNVRAMIRNNSADPKICKAGFAGKLVVITGATSGIGRVTARKFAENGANLLTINRNQEKSEKLNREIESEFGVECNYILADLSRLDDIHRAADRLAELPAPIDILIHNAGVYLTKREETVDGLETLFVVHYLSSFIINEKLKDKLAGQDNARIIIVGSEGHRFAAWGIKLDDMNWERRRYSGLKSYGSAKTAQLLSMFYFDDYFKNSGVTINTMHPGAVKSGTGQENGILYRSFKKKFFDKLLKTPEISAEAIYYLAVADEMDGVSTKFFNLTTEEEPAPPALDRDMVEELVKISKKYGKI
jgi:NAD(P)-dependent dehydrogenase (short-subunit alcohol dehydrogenase family)